MFSSKKVFVVASLVAVSVLVVGAPIAKATFMEPVAVPYHSADGMTWSTPNPDYAVTAAIDGRFGPGCGDTNIVAWMGDDTSPNTDGSGTDPMTGYFVFDLGQKYVVNAGQVWNRDSANLRGPKNIDFFRFLDDTPHGFTNSSYIASDGDVALIGPNTDMTNAQATATTVTFTSPVTARYVGLRLNSSYNALSDGCSMVAEVRFDTSPTPEPSAIILLATGLISLLAYAWRKRK